MDGPTSGAVSGGPGTVPPQFLSRTVLQSIGPSHRTHRHWVFGIAFLIVGWMPFAHGLAFDGIYLPHVEVPFYQPL